jgi:hypothetical protein
VPLASGDGGGVDDSADRHRDGRIRCRAFGDGTTSTEQNPTWEPAAVTAEITLRVSRGNAEDSITERITTPEC